MNKEGNCLYIFFGLLLAFLMVIVFVAVNLGVVALWGAAALGYLGPIGCVFAVIMLIGGAAMAASSGG